MIHVYMRGRLGNQLFQYAFVRSLQEQNPEQDVCYHFDDVYSQGDKGDGWENSLKYFHTVGVKESHKKLSLSFWQRIILFFYWKKYPHKGDIETKNRYQMKWIKLMNKLGLFYLDLGYFPFFIIKSGHDIIVSGNFESERYFLNIKNKLYKEITPIFPVLDKNLDLMGKIRSTASVCISIRRGDFIENADFSRLLNVCTRKYFEAAIVEITKRISNPVFFFFSDDIAWVKENIKINFPCYYETGNDPVWEKLRLMYSCKHFIISNSTFSWWAQYLGKDADKIVIAPNRWYNNEFRPDLYQDSWILVNVDQ